MKYINLTDAELNLLNPEQIVVTQWVGSDDILSRTAAEVIEAYREVFVGGTTSDAIDWCLFAESGNSFKVIVIKDNMPLQLIRVQE